MIPLLAWGSSVSFGLWRWVQRNTPPSLVLPGPPPPVADRLLDLGARLLQGKAPLGALSVVLDGFRVRRGDPSTQLEVHAYVAQLSEDLAQAALFDGNTAGARLIGVEYLIGERLFHELPDGERPLWHSHAEEAEAGLTIAPGLPRAAERALLARHGRTWGKAWCTWDTERDTVPLGAPALLVPPAPGALRCALRESRDHRFGRA
jgi:hypothetical protein